MTKQEYLRQVRRQIHYIFDRNAIEEELTQHLEDSTHDLMESGLSLKEAEQEAVVQMGDPVETGKLLNKEHNPLIGYLYSASILLLVLLLIPASFTAVSFLYSVYQHITPTTIANSTEIMSLDMELDLNTHKVKLDKICQTENGEFHITYRSWIKFDYSRAGWSSFLFQLEDFNGNNLNESRFSSGSFLGVVGYQEFSWPQNDLLYIVTRDGQRVQIDLEGYDNEKN